MLGFSPFSSAPLSALVSRGGTNVNESGSATSSQSAIVTAITAVTETGTASETEISGLVFSQSITESGTVTTSQDLFVPVFALEGLYARDSLTTYKSFLGYQKSVSNGDDGNALFDSWDFVRSDFGGGADQILYANQKYGIAFTASRTAQLGKVALAQAVPYGTAPSAAGAVELWQLSGAPGTATSTLLASIPFYINAGLVNGSYSPLFDFSTVAGASLTNGTSYAILLAGGSDWTSAGLLFCYFPSSGGVAEFIKYSSNYYIYYSFSSTPIGASGTIASGTLWQIYAPYSPIMTIEYASTLVDAEAAINAIPITETVTASESSTKTNTAGAYINNTSPFLDTIVTSISTGTQPRAAIGEPITNGGYGKGLKFIANKTKTLSNIQINAYRINNSISSSTPPISTGKVELWQLDSNTLTGNPSTLLTSRNFSLNDLPSPIQSMSSITNSLFGAASLTSSTTPTYGNNDDGYWTLSLPWSVNYLGNSYSTVFVGTNSYLTFGAGANQYIAVDAANPPVPKICISSADDSAQRIYYGTEGTAPNRTYRIVFEGSANSSGTLGSPTLLWEAVFYENNSSQIDVQIGANARGNISGYSYGLPDGSVTSVPTLWGVYSEEALVGAWPTTSYANVGFRLVSKTTGYPYAYVPVNIDFSSANLSLTSGVAYAVTVTAGSDWSSSASSYLGLYRHDAVGYHNIITAQNTGGLPIYWYLRSVYTPIANNGSTWFAPSTDTNNIFRFTVNSTEESYATDIDVVAASTYYAADAEAGSALDSSVRATPKFGLAAENSAISAIIDSSLFQQYSTSVFPGSLTDGWGIKFVAQKTGQLGSIRFNPLSGGVSVGGSGAVTAGEIRLYQLSTNTLSGTPTTLIATKSIYLTSTTDLLNGLNVGFTNVSGASVTAGVGYAITFYKGSDWSYPTCYMHNIGLIADNTVSSSYYSSTYVGLGGNGIPYMMVGYANIAADSTDALYLSQTQGYNEPLFATDSITQNSTVIAYTGQVHTSTQAPFLSTFSTPHGNGGNSVWGTTGANLSSGRTFIAGFTGPVSYLEFDLINGYGGVRPAPVQTGYAQLWQLASNSITALPNTLLGQIAVMPSIATNSGGPVRIDFSSLNITLTSGVGYALAITAGSDWDLTNTQYLNVYANSDNLYIPYNSTPITRSANTGTWVIASVDTYHQFNMAVYSTYNTADVTDSSQVTTPFVGEQATASDVNTGLKSINTFDVEFSNGVPYTYMLGDTGSGYSQSLVYNTSGTIIGTTFIASYSGSAGIIQLVVMSGDGAIATDLPATLELWQLASNSIASTPSILLGSIPIYPSSFPLTLSDRFSFDFSSANVTLTAGIGYAVVVRPNPSWTGFQGFYITSYIQPSGETRVGNLVYSSGVWYNGISVPISVSVFPKTTLLSDTNTSTISAASAATEVGYSLDTPVALSTGKFGLQQEHTNSIDGGPIVQTRIYTKFSGATGSIIGSNSKIGIGFIAPKSGYLGVFDFDIGFFGSATVTLGAIELWSTASIGGIPQNLLASIPFDINSANSGRYDFNGISGAFLTAGQSYLVAICSGSDWSMGTKTISWNYAPSTASYSIGSGTTGGVSVDVLNSELNSTKITQNLYGYYYGSAPVGSPGTGTGTLASGIMPTADIFYASKSETEQAIFTTSSTLTENSNISATETETGVIPGAGETVNETGSASETESNTVAFVSDRTETGTATETETSQADFYPAVTETGTASETETQSTSGAVNTITETGSANETENRTVTATRDVTETGSANETEDRTVTATRDVTETGTATETEDRLLTATRDVTETGSANETEDRTVTATRDVTETGSANETETNIITASVQRQEIPGNNQARFPEEFTNAIWSKSNGTITANATIDPEGNTTASLFTEDSTVNIRHMLAQTINGVNINTTWTGSIYVKAAPSGRTQVNIALKEYVSFSKQASVFFDVSAGTVGTTANSTGAGVPTGTITSVGNGWYRCSVSVNLNSTESKLGIEIANAASNAVFINGSGAAALYYWGAQVEQGSLTAYTSVANYGNTQTNVITTNQDLTETGTATETEISQANFYPAITETGTATETETNISIQSSVNLETTRKNIYANSDIFGSGWSVNNGTLTSTALTTDPFGGNGAYRLTEDTTLNAIHREVYTAPHIAGTVYTLSVYVKADTRSKFLFFHEEQATVNRAGLTLDLTAGTKTNYTTGTGTVTSSTLTNEGNGWYRASFTFTATTNLSGVTHTFRLIDNLGNPTYTGDGTSGLFIYGPQFEIGSLTAYQANNTLDSDVGIITTFRYIKERLAKNRYLNSDQVNLWGLTNVTISTDSDANPLDGTLNADQVSNTPNLGSTANTTQLTGGGTYQAGVQVTKSVYAKLISGSASLLVSQAITFNPDGTNLTPYEVARFNLSTGLVTSTSGATTSASMESLGNGWYRCIHTFTPSSSIGSNTSSIAGDSWYIGAYGSVSSSCTFALWGAQLEFGSTATTYQYTGSTIADGGSVIDSETQTSFQTQYNTETGSASETETSQADFYPAITETGTGNESNSGSSTTTQTRTETGTASDSETTSLSALNQLWEYTSTNIIKYPNDISASPWTTYNSTLSTNVAVAPDGTQTADKLIGNSGVTIRKSVYYGGAYLTQNTTYTYSVYLKQAGFTNATIWFDIPFANIGPNGYQGSGALINLTDGSTSGTTPTVTTVTSVGNGWYRCSVTGTTNLPWQFGVAGMIPANLQISLGDPNGVGTATGDGTSGIYVWGAQLELSSSVTTFVDPNETVTQTNVITTTQSLTETGSASDSETSQANFYPAITETGTSADSPVGNWTTSSNSSETGSASETESTQIGFVSSLLENTNKNLFYVPSDLSNSIWIKAGSSTITSGQTDPNGGTTAFLLTANLAYSAIYNITPGILPGTYTVSVYVKYGTSTYFTIVNESTTGVDPVAHSATFTMSGTPVLQGAFNATATLTSVGNSWYLATMTYTLVAGATFRPKFWVGTYSGTAFTGQTVYLWRPQVEAGSSVTAFVDPNETVVQSSIITTTQVLTETGTATENETSQANFYPAITETGTGNESNSGSSTTTQTRTETGSAAESESSSAAFVSSNTETGSASETETNIITTNQALTETGSASDSEISQANFYPTRTEAGSASDSESASAIDLGNIVETLLGQDLSTVQTAFISSIQEALNAIETDFGNNVSNRSAAEILSAVDSSTGLPFYAVNINELLNAVVSAVTALPAFITETGSLTAAQFATQLTTAGILEQITATEAELSQLILTSYVTEIAVAGESTVVWIFYPMDYELVTSRYSAGIEIEEDQIYVDNIDVFYLDASKIMVGMDVSFDQIYVDNVDVLYGNIAIIDDIVSDEIYI